MQYNQWYVATYEVILSMANWQDLTADLERKLVCIFSWMPQAIMNVNHSGSAKKGTLKRRSELFGVRQASECVRKAASHLETVKDKELLSLNLQDIREDVLGICGPIFDLLGSVAGSKFLHFSRPRLFPIWDSSLRLSAKLPDSPEGYFEYMKLFQSELELPENEEHARRECSCNPVRGWDVCRMKRKRQEQDGGGNGHEDV